MRLPRRARGPRHWRLAGTAGFEPATFWVTTRRSAAELHANANMHLPTTLASCKASDGFGRYRVNRTHLHLLIRQALSTRQADTDVMVGASGVEPASRLYKNRALYR